MRVTRQTNHPLLLVAYFVCVNNLIVNNNETVCISVVLFLLSQIFLCAIEMTDASQSFIQYRQVCVQCRKQAPPPGPPISPSFNVYTMDVVSLSTVTPAARLAVGIYLLVLLFVSRLSMFN